MRRLELRIGRMAKKDNQAEEFTADTWPVDRWPNFSFDEMRCSHTGDCWLSTSFMDRLQGLRSVLQTPLQISSGFRSPDHPAEVGKPRGPGTHTQGHACDIVCAGGVAWRVVVTAGGLGFRGIGVAQSGDSSRFVHLDDIDEPRWTRPAMWTY